MGTENGSDSKQAIAMLATRAEALRAAISRAQIDLKAASAEEHAISERLRELSSKTATPVATNAHSESAPPSPSQGPSKDVGAETVVAKRSLSRGETWRVALAGAAAATLFGAVGLGIYAMVAPKPVATTTTVYVPTPPPSVMPVGTTIEPENGNEPAPPPVVGTVIGAAPTPPTTVLPPATVQRSSGAFGGAFGRRDRDRDRGGDRGDPNALGAITVVCLPKCDQILVDNSIPLGPGHVFNRPMPVGRHVLSLHAPNGVNKSIVIEVLAERTREVRVAMDAPSTARINRDIVDTRE